MTLKPTLSLVTLGVSNLSRAKKFYTDLGWSPVQQPSDGVAFFELDGIVLSLFPREELAKDAGVADSKPGFSGISLAHNVGSEAEADDALAHAVKCGATLIKPAQKVFWGGYSGYFADPDGHLWEVAYNPFARFDENGVMRMSA
jgi:catechol 2,3-dioxygenase-like lactoylglutathione lyase family enzyme